MFTGCDEGTSRAGSAPSTRQPGDAFYGYTGPGYREEFWILDVEGTRLMIAAERSPARRARISLSWVPSSTPSGSNHTVRPSGPRVTPGRPLVVQTHTTSPPAETGSVAISSATSGPFDPRHTATARSVESQLEDLIRRAWSTACDSTAATEGSAG